MYLKIQDFLTQITALRRRFRRPPARAFTIDLRDFPEISGLVRPSS